LNPAATDCKTVITYRPFRNTDPPALARIWRGQPPLRGRAPSMSAFRLEELVLAKPYFDPHGLIVATDEDAPVGFVHAGFGPTVDLSALSRKQGVVSTLLVQDDPRHDEIAAALLNQAEAYLRGGGAEKVLAGGAGPNCPFYLGLYGGSRLPGILDSDTALHDFYLRHGYTQSDHIGVLHRELASFRPITDRTQVQIRRCTQVEIVEDPPARNWWEACTLGTFEQIAVQMDPKDHGQPWASARFWSMGPLGQAWGVNAVGLIDIEVDPNRRGGGVATCLLGEALRPLAQRGITLVEAQVSDSNAAAQRLLRRLGFVQVDGGTVLTKNVNGAEPGERGA